MKEELFGCSCGGLDHVIGVMAFPDDGGQVYVTTLIPRSSLWRRVKRAFAYVFSNNDLQMNETILYRDEAKRMGDLLVELSTCARPPTLAREGLSGPGGR